MRPEFSALLALCGACVAGAGFLAERATVRQLAIVWLGMGLFATGLVWSYVQLHPLPTLAVASARVETRVETR